jgi:hypothetical protein
MEAALPTAKARIASGGQLALLTTVDHAPADGRSIPLPNSQSGVLYLMGLRVTTRMDTRT